MVNFHGDDAMVEKATTMLADLRAFLSQVSPEQKQGITLFAIFWASHIAAGHKNIFATLRYLLAEQDTQTK